MNTAQATASAMLAAAFPLLNSGTGIIYSGTQPATPETALSGNTALATADFASTALSGSITYSSGYMVGSLAFTSTSISPLRQWHRFLHAPLQIGRHHGGCGPHCRHQRDRRDPRHNNDCHRHHDQHYVRSTEDAGIVRSVPDGSSIRVVGVGDRHAHRD